MKIALITGSSTGIGAASALSLARAGFRVTATMRDPGKGAALAETASAEGLQLEVLALDVTDDRAVQTVVAGLLERFGAVDVLVNNAGAGYLGTTEQTPLADLQRVFDANFFGVWRVTQAVLPAMRQAGSGRIISVSSIGGLVAQPFNDAYCASKFALEGMMESLAPVVAKFGIRLSVIEPGPVHTAFLENVSGMNRPEDAYTGMLGAYLAATNAGYARAGQSAEEVAAVILEAATSDAPHLRYQTSELMRSRVAQKFVDPSGDGLVAAMRAVLDG